MPYADINGQRINYEVTGSGTPVVLITGFAADITYWNSLMPLLSDNYKVIAIDNRGGGKTIYSGKFTTDDMVSDIIALMNHLSVFKAHIVGWSMGGCMAQEIALRHPERVISLTLVSAYMRRPSRSSYVMNTMIKAVKQGADLETLFMVMRVMCFPESSFRKKEEKGTLWSKQPCTASIEGIIDQMANVDIYDSRKRISGITVPTLSISGLEDMMVPPSVGEEISSLIKGCRSLKVPGAGHNINHTEYVKRMTEHFKENE
ncbi:MAG: alpha/beta hydrolase [Methanomassiliicoccaceae archaeon]|jgi:pimeloyl-ACP methyl ester carboxylesterase|nr:alpha/beta hydrolase [Methanomassiliicoccaceae archaeon]